MGYSTNNNFRSSNSGLLSRTFWGALALNAVVALGSAAYQEHLENIGEVYPDGRNLVTDSVVKFVWEQPKWVVTNAIDLITEPE